MKLKRNNSFLDLFGKKSTLLKQCNLSFHFLLVCRPEDISIDALVCISVNSLLCMEIVCEGKIKSPELGTTNQSVLLSDNRTGFREKRLTWRRDKGLQNYKARGNQG